MYLDTTKIGLSNRKNEYLFDKSLYSDSLFKINASIVLHNGQYWSAHRSNNLDRNNKNYLTELNADFTYKQHKHLVAENGNSAVEDIRLFSFGGKLLAIYTYLPYVNNQWVHRFSVGIGTIDTIAGKIINQQELQAYSTRAHEKNWIPLIENEILYLITDFDPYLRVLRASGDPGNLKFEEVHMSTKTNLKWDFGEIRGGTPFIKSNDVSDHWQYCFVHSSVHVPNGINYSRFYTYSILRLDLQNFNFQIRLVPDGYSPDEDEENYNNLWHISSNSEFFRVVFPMGIINYNNGVLISYGKDDCVSRLRYYSWEYIYSIFNDN